jgi:hypothetical protein
MTKMNRKINKKKTRPNQIRKKIKCKNKVPIRPIKIISKSLRRFRK